MATFSVRVPDALAAAFDQAAEARGGRSARLRQLIAADAGGAPVRPSGLRSRLRSTARVMVRLKAAEAAGVAVEAQALQVTPSAWIAALVRARVIGAPAFRAVGDQDLMAIRGEIRRIGVNVNQIARALNTAVMEGRVLDLELGEIAALRRELRAHFIAIGEAFEGNLTYWATGL